MPRQIDLSPQNLSVNNDPNNQLGFTQEQVVNLKSQIPIALEKAELEFINAVLQAIDQSTGLDLEKFTQEAQAGITYTGNLATDLWNYLVGTNTTATEANTLATQAWNELVDFFETGDFSDLTTAMQSIFQAIFGSSTSLGLVGSIPAPAVVNVTQDIQPVFDFPDAQSVSAGGQWSWDGTVDHTGITGSGSAKCVANGLLQALKGIPGAVQSGQIVTASGRVQWSGLTYTGTNPVQIQLVPYAQVGSELVAGTPFEVAQLGSPASSGSWTYLSGTYTVPSSGVDAVQLRLVVAANTTAGSVWFDDCECNVSGGYLATLQNDLTDLQTDSTASTAAFATFITSVESAISSYTSWSSFISSIESAWVTYSTAESALTSSAIFTLQNFFNTAFGISPSTGFMAPTNVGNVLGGSSLGSDVSSVHTTATNGTAWATRLTNDLVITSDVFHLVYQVGTSTDAPGHLGTNGKPTWYSAWNDLLALTGVVNSTTAPTDAAPTVGSAITTASANASTAITNAATAQSTASTAQSTLNTTNTNLFNSTTPTPGAAIQQAAVPTGIPATKVANVLGGANLGADVSTVSTTASNGTSWATRLTNDLLITSDVFHLTYAAGSSGDAPGTIWSGGGVGNGKPTWYSAWNDLRALTGVVNSTSAPTDSAPTVGTAITTAQSTATTASTAASAAQSTATTAASTASAAQSTLNTTNTVLFNSTTPTTANQVQSTAVQGTQGITDISTTIQNTWDNFATSIANIFGWNVSSSGNSLSATTGILQQHAQATDSALTLATSASNALAAMATSQPLSTGLSNALIASTMSLFNITSSPPTGLSINANNALLGFIQFQQAGQIGSVTWLGSYTPTAPSSVTANVYSLNTSTGLLTNLESSGNLASEVIVNSSAIAKNAGWIVYNLATPITVTAGEVLAFELTMPSGATGILQLFGAQANIPLYSAAYPECLGGSHSLGGGTVSPSTVALGSGSSGTYAFSAVTPWVGVDGPTATPYYFPVTTEFLSSTTYTVPSWATHLDVIGVGGGGGGGNGFGASGGNGSSTTVVNGSNSLTATAGSGGSSGTSGSSSYATGTGPGPDSYSGVVYHGGTNVSPQSAGSSPGGGAGGGVNYGAATYGQGGSAGSFNTATWTVTPSSTVTITIGGGGSAGTGGFGAGAGAGGAVWLVARQ